MMVMGMSLNGLGYTEGVDDPCTTATQNCENGCASDDDACFSNCSTTAQNSSGCQSYINSLASSGSSSSGGSSGSSGSSGTSWWGTALTSITQGATAGIFNNGVNCTLPQNAALPQCQTQPWYTTPFGIIAIVGLLGGGIYLLTKK